MPGDECARVMTDCRSCCTVSDFIDSPLSDFFSDNWVVFMALGGFRSG